MNFPVYPDTMLLHTHTHQNLTCGTEPPYINMSWRHIQLLSVGVPPYKDTVDIVTFFFILVSMVLPMRLR